MSVEVKVPSVGESITEGVLVEWEKAAGDPVEVDDPLFVLETDKVTMTINSELSGVLEILVPAGETVQIGQVVGRIGAQTRQASAEESKPAETAPPGPTPVPASPPSTAVAPGLSPAVRRLVKENQLDPGQIPGSGRGGRITKEDVLQFLETSAAAATEEKPASVSPTPAPAVAPPRVEEPKRSAGERQTRTPMTQLRKRIAERLVQSQQTAAILTTFNEVDMTNLLEWRKKYQDVFVKKYGIKLGLMSFFVKASVDALRTIPQVNGFIDGDDIVQNHYYDIGVAVGTERGLIVPVVRNADQLSFAEIEVKIADLARRAEEKTLTLDELTGGCFTVSNGGVYGSLLSTPILNPPQSGILGMHTIKKRPVAVGDEIQVRPMMYLALSYDHRLIDGRESVAFLRRIVDCIENPERMMLQI